MKALRTEDRDARERDNIHDNSNSNNNTHHHRRRRQQQRDCQRDCQHQTAAAATLTTITAVGNSNTKSSNFV